MTSIVEHNIERDFEKEQLEIDEAQDEELAQLKELGRYQNAKWWCLYLCGDGPTKKLEAEDRQIELDKRIELRELELAKKSGDSSWWPF